MTIKDAIQKGIDLGYKKDIIYDDIIYNGFVISDGDGDFIPLDIGMILLDIHFWECLYKSEGWIKRLNLFVEELVHEKSIDDAFEKATE